MAELWTSIHEFQDIRYERTADGIAKITINRPEVRNAFRPLTVNEMKQALDMARDDSDIGVIIFTGEGTDAFCSGGDQRVRGKGGYVDPNEKIPRLNILDVQKQIRSMPKPVVAMVAGYAIGGGHVLHVVCDLTIAADNARFGQTGPRVGSFDAGLGSSYLARIVGQKKVMPTPNSVAAAKMVPVPAWAVWESARMPIPASAEHVNNRPGGENL